MPELSSDDLNDLLVAYALDVLEPAELELVGQLLAERPELRQSLAELRATAGLLPYALPAGELPPALRQQVLDRAAGRATVAAPAQQAALLRRWRGWLYALGALTAASMIALALALGALDDTRRELQLAQQQVAQTERTLASLNRERAQVAQVLAGATSLAELRGAAGRATVLKASGGDLLLAVQLPPLAPGQVYQLWVITDQRTTPTSAGSFTVDAAGYGLLALDAAAPGSTLAITAEPAPGSPAPTTPVLVTGQIS